MCGIVGYLGKRQASDILVNALSKLEYRGYDSAGVAIMNDGIQVRKFKGRLSNLAESLEESRLSGSVGIGHTRWATHGEPSDVNSHPHSTSNLKISVVHNGIIENYSKLRSFLSDKGYEFKSETDTEVIPNMIDYCYSDNLYDAVVEATKYFEGSYAIAVMCEDEPNKIVAVKKDSPLIVGVGKEEFFIASDIPAVLNETRDIYLLEDNEFVVISNDGIELMDSEGNKIKKDIYYVTWDVDSAEKNGYEDFMLKEIYEQPRAIRDTILGKVSSDSPITLGDVVFTKEELESYKKVYIVACGTAYHAGLIGKTVIERLAHIPVEIDVASEFRYRQPLISNDTLVIVVSQSGETADTLAVLRDSKNKGAKVLAITNVVGSTVSREADSVIYTVAGPEIAVASTKAYVTQVTAFYMLAIHFAEVMGMDNGIELAEIKRELLEIPHKIECVLENINPIKEYAKKHYNDKDIYFLGRGLDYAVALEASLKLKEISYIHCDAYAGGELKHGPIALIDKNTPVIAIVTQESLKDKMMSNVKEVSTRGGDVFSIINEDTILEQEYQLNSFAIPKTIEVLTPLLSVVPLQLLSYFVAKNKGCDVDKPRNLAKSVTVE